MDSVITGDQLAAKLMDEIEASYAKVVDVSSDQCGAKFEAIVVSPQFEGKTLLNRHRLVNTTLAEEMKGIHAFSMKTFTPDQWEKEKAKH